MPSVDRNSCHLADSPNRACSVIVVCDDAEAARSLSTFMQPGAHAFPLPLGNPPAFPWLTPLILRAAVHSGWVLDSVSHFEALMPLKEHPHLLTANKGKKAKGRNRQRR